MGKVLKLVIFDCDGTLVDSQHIIHAAMVHAYESSDLMPPDREETLKVVGLSLTQAIQNISPDFDTNKCEEIAEDYKKSFGLLRADSSLAEPMFEGAAEILEKLRNLDHTLLGIATGKSRKGVDSFLKRESLHGYFDTIQTADDALSKPHPMMLEQALAETGVNASEALMVGDTTYDMQMAKNAGVQAIGVSWGYHSVEELRISGADRVLNSFSELYSVL